MQPKGWHKWLSIAQWWYNSCHHSSINMSPFKALYGYKPVLLSAVRDPPIVTEVGAYMQQSQEVVRLLKAELTKARNKMKQMADRRRSERPFLE